MGWNWRSTRSEAKRDWEALKEWLDSLPEVELTAERERMLEEARQDQREGRVRQFDSMEELIAALKLEAGLD